MPVSDRGGNVDVGFLFLLLIMIQRSVAFQSRAAQPHSSPGLSNVLYMLEREAFSSEPWSQQRKRQTRRQANGERRAPTTPLPPLANMTLDHHSQRPHMHHVGIDHRKNHVGDDRRKRLWSALSTRCDSSMTDRPVGRSLDRSIRTYMDYCK
jgi:hypothetical protein